MKRVVVVGGGISGLAAAYYLLKRSKAAGEKVSVTVLEEQPRLGGKIVTEREAGYVIEGGPDSFISLKPEAIALCEELGLADSLVRTNDENNRTYILRDGRLEPIPAGLDGIAPTRLFPFLNSRLLSWSGKRRALAEAFVARKRGETDESVADFVRRRMGGEFYDRIAEPLLSGIYAGDARTLSLRATFPRLAEMERSHGSVLRAAWRRGGPARAPGPWSLFVSLRGGVATLVERLASVLELEGAALRTGWGLEALRVLPDRSFELSSASERLEADAVVLAVPAYVSARLVADLDPYLAAELEQLRYNASATVSLAYERADFPARLRGFGFVVPRVEGRLLLACTWSSLKYPERAPQDKVLVRGYLGDARKRDWLPLSDEKLAEVVREDLGAILELWREPVLTKVFRWERAMPHYAVGHRKWVESLERRLRGRPGLYLAGASYRGVGIPDCVKDAAETAARVLA